MPTTLQEFLHLDLAALLTAVVCSISCALVGTFLILRRQSLLGDAIAHSVLPGLAVAFLLSGSRVGLPIYLGAMIAGVASALAAEGLRRIARVEAGAAMGVVFSAMFALGVLLMSLPQMRAVDLDADCVLNGVLETIIWTSDPAAGTRSPDTFTDLLSPAVLAGMPRQLASSLIVLGAITIIIVALFKELRLATFDPGLAAALGFRPGLLNTLLIILVAACSVASFEAVGSILVIAMLICPAAAARMLTDNLRIQLILSSLLAATASIVGYVLASFGPAWVNLPHADALSASGMIAMLTGVQLAIAVLLAPSHGLIARRLRTLRLNISIMREDLLAMLYRIEEQRPTVSDRALATHHIRAALAQPLLARFAIRQASARGEIILTADAATLTDRGRQIATSLVRSHRLWEHYLVHELGLRPDHVHRTAMELEHHTSLAMQSKLTAAAPHGEPPTDPHGRAIP